MDKGDSESFGGVQGWGGTELIKRLQNNPAD